MLRPVLEAQEQCAGLLKARMPEALAQRQGGGKALPGQVGLAQRLVTQTAQVQGVGLGPGVLTVGLLGAVERLARAAEGGARFGNRQVDAR